MTQKELAAKVHVTQACVSKWEHSKSIPSMDDLQLVARALDVPVLILLGADMTDVLGGLNALATAEPQEPWVAELADYMRRQEDAQTPPPEPSKFQFLTMGQELWLLLTWLSQDRPRWTRKDVIWPG